MGQNKMGFCINQKKIQNRKTNYFMRHKWHHAAGLSVVYLCFQFDVKRELIISETIWFRFFTAFLFNIGGEIRHEICH